MDRQQLTMMANKFQSVFDASLLNERGNQLEFCWRQRQITPFRFGLSVVASMASQEVQSIADLQRHFNALWDAEVSYKAFYNQLAKASCASFLLTSLSDIMGKLTMKVLGFEAGQALSEFHRIVIQDGSSFALHDALAQVFPGRFNTVKPAAVELHCTMDLLQDAPLTIVLSPDTDSEHAYLPPPESLQGALFLADRGYLDLTYLRDVDRHGGFFLVRGKEGLNPRVIDAVREDGKRVKSCQDRAFQAIITKLPKKQRGELDVEWLLDHQLFRLRLITSWHKATQSFVYLLTNLPQARYDMHKICLGYKLRWQVELVFKEWKSYANLHAFDTENEHIAEALIWASLAASALKRFLAHAAEHLLEVVVSTRKAAMPSAYVLPELFRALRSGSGPWYRRAFEAMIRYLGSNAKRAHPQRDARTGRSQLGLKPIFALTDHKALMDSREEQVAA
jgi:Transposase DDE domain